MTERFGVVDVGAGKAWQFAEKAVAVRYAAGRHAATGNVVEVVRWTDDGSEVYLVLPPDAPSLGCLRRSVVMLMPLRSARTKPKGDCPL